jgi:hypothetical protein
MAKLYMRVRETFDHVLVSVCDEELLGKTLVEGELEFNVNPEFYGGELVDTKTCVKYLQNATVANMVGKNTVNAAIKAGLVHETAVLYIEGEPHAQWVKL